MATIHGSAMAILHWRYCTTFLAVASICLSHYVEALMPHMHYTSTLQQQSTLTCVLSDELTLHYAVLLLLLLVVPADV
jgi:hypothetical protein